MKILVIEDNEKHLNDAREYSSKLVGCTVDFATTLAEAMGLLEKNSYDGVISDVFFPAEAGGSAETFENAITLSTRLVEMGVHHVFNTDGNHHGRKLMDFCWKTPKAIHNDNNYHFFTTGMLIEAYPKDPDGSKSAKQWQAAFRYILLVQTVLRLPDKGEAIWHSGSFPSGGFPYGDRGELTEMYERYALENPFVGEIFRRFNT